MADRASSLVTGLPPLVCKSIAKASNGRIPPSGDADITALVLDIAATASHPSVRPVRNGSGQYPAPRSRGPCQLLGVVYSYSSLGSVLTEQLARNGVPTIDIVDPDVMEVVNLTRRTYLGDDIHQAKAGGLHGICASAVRPDAELRAIRVATRVATPQISLTSVSVHRCRNRWYHSEFGHWRTAKNVLPRSGGLRVIDRRSVRLSSVVVGYLWGMRT